MKKYPKMKHSGVEWIGDVPENWEVKRLKHVADIFGRIGFRGYTVNDIVEAGQGVITLSPGNIKKDTLILDSAAYLSLEKYYESPEIMIFPNDIILVKTGSTIGKTAIIPENVSEMTLNPQLVVLKNLKILPKFLYYQTTCPFFKNSFDVEQTGGTTPTISQEKVNSFLIVSPPEISEQEAIVKYIDQKTTQIDTTITEKQGLIELFREERQAIINHAVTKGIRAGVKMKASGVEWIGDVPEGWEVKSVSNLAIKLTNGFVGPTRDILFDSGVRYLQSLHIKNNSIDFDKKPYYVNQKWSDKHSKSILQEGDILIVQTGDIGQVACVPSDFVGSNCHALIIFRVKPEYGLGRFFSLVLNSNYGFHALKSIETGALHPHLNCGNVQNVLLPVPPLNEQVAIVSYLDQKTAQIDTAISGIQQEIALLQEYRQALIFEAVTGKVCVI